MPTRSPEDIKYPLKGYRERAVISWRGDKLDLGKHGTTESLLTYFHLRQHLVAGGEVPNMAQFRNEVMQEHRDESAAVTEELRKEAEQLQDHTNKLRIDLAHHREISEKSKRSAQESESQISEWQTKLARIKRVGSFVGVAGVLLILALTWALINNSGLSDTEKKLVEDLRKKSPELVSTGTSGWVDDILLTDQEIEIIRGIREFNTNEENSPAAAGRVAQVTRNFLTQGLKDAPKVNRLPQFATDPISDRYAARRVSTEGSNEAPHND